jgi:hypothetical protein
MIKIEIKEAVNGWRCDITTRTGEHLENCETESQALAFAMSVLADTKNKEDLWIKITQDGYNYTTGKPF